MRIWVQTAMVEGDPVYALYTLLLRKWELDP
jgi:hypothetical protein